MKALLLFVVGVACTVAQPFTLGVKVGVPANDFLKTVESASIGSGLQLNVNVPNFNFHSYTNRYLFGGTGELRLPFGLGVEVDALYRHYNFQTVGALNPPGTTLTVRGSTGAWEFPLLAKYRFRTKIVRPFVDAGVAWDTLQGFKQAISVVSPVPIVAPANFNQPSHGTTAGFVIGGGLDIHVPFVHISPEVRYTHWGTPHFVAGTVTSGVFTANTGYTSNRNQVEAMIGITF